MRICTVGSEKNFTLISCVRKTDIWALIHSGSIMLHMVLEIFESGNTGALYVKE